jgi:hypothetical protein
MLLLRVRRLLGPVEDLDPVRLQVDDPEVRNAGLGVEGRLHVPVEVEGRTGDLDDETHVVRVGMSCGVAVAAEKLDPVVLVTRRPPPCGSTRRPYIAAASGRLVWSLP